MEQRIQPLNTNTGRQSTTQQNIGRRNAATSKNQTSQTARTIGTQSNYAITRSPSALHVGDTIRGEITDLRNNEISITLEDNTTIRAQIPDSSNYSIGQIGTFRLSDISGTTLFLENISVGYSDTEMAMINKALEEAMLPTTEHNQAAVKALIDNMLPINRTSIQNLMQQAYDYKTDDMNTLAVMNRLMMPIDEDTVTQFSNYRNNNYELLDRIQSFSKDIPALLHILADNSNAESVASFGKDMLSITLSGNNNIEQSNTPVLANFPKQVQDDVLALLSNTPMTEEMAEKLDNKSITVQEVLNLLRDSANDGKLVLPEGMETSTLTDGLNRILNALDPSNDTSNLTEDFVKNSITLNNEAEITEESATTNSEVIAQMPQEKEQTYGNPFLTASKLFHHISDSAKNTINDTLNSLKNSDQPHDIQNSSVSESSLDILANSYEKIARGGDLLGSYLGKAERSQLADLMKSMPISKNLLDKIVSGEASTKEVLTVIHNTISLSDDKVIASLFQSDVFEKLFQKELQTTWTITPNQLKNENLSDFYTKMRNQLDEFRTLIQTNLSGSDSNNLSNFARDMENNISFMKTLNENFSFFQLPLKLQNQDAHGDLYVYTQKEKLRQHPDKNSVLLHLNLEHLGEIDIRIERNNRDISTNFSLNDDESVTLFKTNSIMLEDALERQGYNPLVQIAKKDTPSPTMDDFINTKVNTHATSDMKRFSFDIRA